MTDISQESTDMVTNNADSSVFVDGRLVEDIRELIESSKSRFAQAANAALVMLFWNVGTRINAEILGNERAEYGKKIVLALSRQLTAEYGKGFTRSNLFYMIRFAEFYPDEQIVHALSGQLSWTHFREIPCMPKFMVCSMNVPLSLKSLHSLPDRNLIPCKKKKNIKRLNHE